MQRNPPDKNGAFQAGAVFPCLTSGRSCCQEGGDRDKDMLRAEGEESDPCFSLNFIFIIQTVH